MDKLWLIVQREYLTRVKKKSFILITLLSPIIFVALFTVPVMVTLFVAGTENKSLVVRDDSGVFLPPVDTAARASFTLSQEPLDVLKASYKNRGFDGVLYIPTLSENGEKISLQYFSEAQLSLGVIGYVSDKVAEQMESKKIKAAGYSEEVMKNFKTDVSIEQEELAFNEKGQLVETGKKNSAELATVIGFVSGFVIYIVLIFYGAMIMRSVMEEKTSRIVEVIISSVKPFQLMMGKILGVSAVGLTQMLAWIVMTFVLTTLTTAFLGMDTDTVQTSMNAMQQVPTTMPPSLQTSKAAEVFDVIAHQNWSYILPLFLFYFVGGYFIYASLFAAVGASMGDDQGESQSLSLVAMAPIILSIILISPVIESPTSPLARWMSIFPLFSPVIMPARLAFEPPLWEVIVSMVVLAGSAVFFVWLSGRIYRVGVLLYGKKATLKEMIKWTFSKA